MRGRRVDVAVAALLIVCGVLFGRIAEAADGTVAASGGSGVSSSGSSNDGSSNKGTSSRGGGSGTSKSTPGGGDTGGGDTGGGDTGTGAGTEPSGTGAGTPSPGPTVTSIVNGDNRAGGSTSDVDVTVIDIDVTTGQRVSRVERRVNQAPLATIASLLILVVVAGVVAVAVREAGRPR